MTTSAVSHGFFICFLILIVIGILVIRIRTKIRTKSTRQRGVMIPNPTSYS